MSSYCMEDVIVFSHLQMTQQVHWLVVMVVVSALVSCFVLRGDARLRGHLPVLVGARGEVVGRVGSVGWALGGRSGV